MCSRGCGRPDVYRIGTEAEASRPALAEARHHARSFPAGLPRRHRTGRKSTKRHAARRDHPRRRAFRQRQARGSNPRAACPPCCRRPRRPPAPRHPAAGLLPRSRGACRGAGTAGVSSVQRCRDQACKSLLERGNGTLQAGRRSERTRTRRRQGGTEDTNRVVFAQERPLQTSRMVLGVTPYLGAIDLQCSMLPRRSCPPLPADTGCTLGQRPTAGTSRRRRGGGGAAGCSTGEVRGAGPPQFTGHGPKLVDVDGLRRRDLLALGARGLERTGPWSDGGSWCAHVPTRLSAYPPRAWRPGLSHVCSKLLTWVHVFLSLGHARFRRIRKADHTHEHELVPNLALHGLTETLRPIPEILANP
jgi:hypothetical protein